MPDMSSRQSVFSHRAHGKKSNMSKQEKTSDMFLAYGDFRDLVSRTTSDKVLRDKVFEIAHNPNWDGYKRALPSIIYIFWVKNAGDTDTHTATEISEDRQSANEPQRPITRKFSK